MTNVLYDALFAPHRDSNRIFIEAGETSVSFGAFVAQSARVAAALRESGLQPGDRLAAQIGKSVTALAVYA